MVSVKMNTTHDDQELVVTATTEGNEIKSKSIMLSFCDSSSLSSIQPITITGELLTFGGTKIENIEETTIMDSFTPTGCSKCTVDSYVLADVIDQNAIRFWNTGNIKNIKIEVSKQVQKSFKIVGEFSDSNC